MKTQNDINNIDDMHMRMLFAAVLLFPPALYVFMVIERIIATQSINVFKVLNPSLFSIDPWYSSHTTAAMISISLYILILMNNYFYLYSGKHNSHGTSKWASKDYLKKKGMIQNSLDFEKAAMTQPLLAKLGSAQSNQPYVVAPEKAPHTLICATTGSGKGVGVIIPTLLTWAASAIVLDVKGENFELTSRFRRSKGDRVYRFAPLDPDFKSHRFNPVIRVQRANEHRRYTEALRLATSLIASTKGGEAFIRGSREIFCACILTAIEQRSPTISRAYDILCGYGKEEEETGYNEMMLRLAFETQNPQAKQIYTRMSGIDPKTLGIYISVLMDGGLSLWGDVAVRTVTSGNDFDILTFRKIPSTLYLDCPPNDIDTLAPLFRLLFQQSITAIQDQLPDKKEIFPVLFLMDEFASLGELPVIKQGITTLRGYGGRLMIVVQSLSNLTEKYGQQGGDTIIANCKSQYYCAPNENTTPDILSKALGTYTRKAKSISGKKFEVGKNISQSVEGAPLMRPDEIRRLDDSKVIILTQSQYPIFTDRITYYQDKQLKRIFESQTGPLILPEPLQPDTPHYDSITQPEPAGVAAELEPIDEPINVETAKNILDNLDNQLDPEKEDKTKLFDEI